MTAIQRANAHSNDRPSAPDSSAETICRPLTGAATPGTTERATLSARDRLAVWLAGHVLNLASKPTRTLLTRTIYAGVREVRSQPIDEEAEAPS